MLHISHFNDKYNLIKSSDGIKYFWVSHEIGEPKRYDKETIHCAANIFRDAFIWMNIRTRK